MQRVSKQDGDGFTEFVYQGPDMLKLLLERDDQGETQAHYTMGQGLEAMRIHWSGGGSAVTDARRRLVALLSLGLLLLCVITANVAYYLHCLQQGAKSPQIDIPVFPGAEVTADRIGGGKRQVQCQVAVSYPSLAVLEFYKRELEGDGDWMPAELSWLDTPGVWEKADFRVAREVGGVPRPPEPSQGVMAVCQQAWEQRDGDTVLWVSVRDFSQLDMSARPKWARVPDPPQEVTVVLMSGEQARAVSR